MYVPSFNEEQDLAVLHALIKAKPFALWSALARGAISVNQLPFVLHEGNGELGTLTGHVARANPIWKELTGDTESVVVFQGEQAYISPSWYPSKRDHGKAVPTWNYAVVQARGVPNVIDNKGWLLQHVTELTTIHEQQQAQPWQVDDAPADFIDKLLNAIVGIEIPITNLTGKWKLGQNRPHADQQGMIVGLNANGDPASAAMSALMQQTFD